MAKFCGDCANCGDQYGSDRVKRLCKVAEERRVAHLEARGYTPDAYWTVPNKWIYSNSQHAERCGLFTAINQEVPRG